MQSYSFLLLEQIKLHQVYLAKYEHCHTLFECINAYTALVSFGP